MAHLDRKLYEMRELRSAGVVTVKYVPTDENTADLFTKVLQRQYSASPSRSIVR